MVDSEQQPPPTRQEKLQLKRFQNVARGLMLFKRSLIISFIGVFSYKLYKYTTTPEYESFKARRKLRIQSEATDPDAERLYDLEKREMEIKEKHSGKLEAEIA